MHHARGDRGNMAGRRLCGVFSAALHESSGSLPELVDALLPSFGELSEAQIRGSRPSSAKPGSVHIRLQASPTPKPVFLYTGALDGFSVFFCPPFSDRTLSPSVPYLPPSDLSVEPVFQMRREDGLTHPRLPPSAAPRLPLDVPIETQQ